MNRGHRERKKSGGRSEVALGGPTVQEKSKNDGEMFFFFGGGGSQKYKKIKQAI